MKAKHWLTVTCCCTAAILTGCGEGSAGTATLAISPTPAVTSSALVNTEGAESGVESTTTGGESSSVLATTAAASNGKSYEINDVSYSCSSLIGTSEFPNCGKQYQRAFNTWGENLDAYVNSGELGAVGNGSLPLSDEVLIGLEACIMLEGNASEWQFVDFQSRNYPQISQAHILPFWLQAAKILCTDQKIADTEDHLTG